MEVPNEDVKGLDRLLAFYRSKPPGGCTTVDHMTIQQRRDGKVIAEEQFTDASCSSGEKHDLTSIHHLIQQAKSEPVEEEIR
jgi:hypothetical protein